ncbi:hypothetical protein ACQP1K_16640 [Sphaerimonospora sp. CA-214678]|uniref:hypothetical protein n=1 Tax=Sphaerimonospora sp. CA-214678 TaxID=3240029 RepID=UPI003D90AB53
MKAAELVVENVYSDFTADLPSEEALTTTLKAYADLGVIKPDPVPDYDELVVAPGR